MLTKIVTVASMNEDKGAVEETKRCTSDRRFKRCEHWVTYRYKMFCDHEILWVGNFLSTSKCLIGMLLRLLPWVNAVIQERKW